QEHQKAVQQRSGEVAQNEAVNKSHRALDPVVFAKVVLAGDWIIGQIVGGAGGSNLAFRDDIRPFCDLQCGVNIVVGDKDSDVSLLQAVNDLLNLLNRHWIHACERLVQQDES